jgi:hypothetical protein
VHSALISRGVLHRHLTRISFISVKGFRFWEIVENFCQVRVREYRSCVVWADFEFRVFCLFWLLSGAPGPLARAMFYSWGTTRGVPYRESIRLLGNVAGCGHSDDPT